MRLLLSCLCGLALGCATPHAASPVRGEVPAAPTAAPQLQPVGFFLGVWRCTARFPSGSVLPFRWELRPVLGGHFFAGAVYGAAEQGGGEVNVSQDAWGFDPLERVFTRDFRDNEGSFGRVVTRGWVAEVLEFEGSMVAGGARLQVKERVTRAGPDRLLAVWQLKAEGEEWKPMTDEECRR